MLGVKCRATARDESRGAMAIHAALSAARARVLTPTTPGRQLLAGVRVEAPRFGVETCCPAELPLDVDAAGPDAPLQYFGAAATSSLRRLRTSAVS